MNKRSQAVTKHRQKRKTELIRIMGSKCALCGYDKNIAALDLHHLNPQEKEYQLSSGYCRSIEEDIQEIKKCVLLCSNCHREIHNGMWQDLSSSFQQDIADEVLKEYQQFKTKTVKTCPSCGKIISKTSNLCIDCYNKIQQERRLINRPSREELKKLIRTIPFTKIGQKYLVTDNAIRKWCDGYNLPRNKKDIKKFSDDEWAKI